MSLRSNVLYLTCIVRSPYVCACTHTRTYIRIFDINMKVIELAIFPDYFRAENEKVVPFFERGRMHLDVSREVGKFTSALYRFLGFDFPIASILIFFKLQCLLR